jgi:hypothetical protein
VPGRTALPVRTLKPCLSPPCRALSGNWSPARTTAAWFEPLGQGGSWTRAADFHGLRRHATIFPEETVSFV